MSILENPPNTIKKKRKGRREYTTIQIPKTLMEEVNRIIQLGILGYTSRMEFVKDAVRDKILQLQPYLTQKKKEGDLAEQHLDDDRGDN